MSGPERPPSQDLSKPTVSELQASALVESVFGLKVTDIHPLPSYDDQNFHVRVPGAARDGGGPLECGPLEYVLKVNNTESSKNPDLVEVQSRVMMFLRAESFPVAAVHPTKGGSLTSLMAIGIRRKSSHRGSFLFLFGLKIMFANFRTVTGTPSASATPSGTFFLCILPSLLLFL